MPSDVKPRVFQHGGKRDRACRVTNNLSERDVTRLAQATRAANDIGLPLNRMITIHWERASVPAGRAVRATGQYLAMLRNAIGKRGFAYVWIRENDDGDGAKGDHVHILAHIPVGYDLGKRQRSRITAISGKSYVRGTILTSRIGGTLGAARASPAHYHANLAAVAAYVLKGGTQAVIEAIGLGRWGEGGRVVGQRTGMSKNLSRYLRKSPVAGSSVQICEDSPKWRADVCRYVT